MRNSRQALTGLDDDEKYGVTITDSMGRDQAASAVNESGVYSLYNAITQTRSKSISKMGNHRSPANYSQNFLYQKHVT